MTDSNPIARSSPDSGGSSGIRDLQAVLIPGAVISGRVLESLGDARYAVQLRGRVLVADSKTPLQKGEVVRVRVESVGDQIRASLMRDDDVTASSGISRIQALGLPAGAASMLVLEAFERIGAPLQPDRLLAAALQVDEAFELPLALLDATKAEKTGSPPERLATAFALLARANLPAIDPLLNVALNAAHKDLPNPAAALLNLRAIAQSLGVSEELQKSSPTPTSESPPTNEIQKPLETGPTPVAAQLSNTVGTMPLPRSGAGPIQQVVLNNPELRATTIPVITAEDSSGTDSKKEEFFASSHNITSVSDQKKSAVPVTTIGLRQIASPLPWDSLPTKEANGESPEHTSLSTPGRVAPASMSPANLVSSTPTLAPSSAPRSLQGASSIPALPSTLIQAPVVSESPLEPLIAARTITPTTTSASIPTTTSINAPSPVVPASSTTVLSGVPLASSPQSSEQPDTIAPMPDADVSWRAILSAPLPDAERDGVDGILRVLRLAGLRMTTDVGSSASGGEKSAFTLGGATAAEHEDAQRASLPLIRHLAVVATPPSANSPTRSDERPAPLSQIPAALQDAVVKAAHEQSSQSIFRPDHLMDYDQVMGLPLMANGQPNPARLAVAHRPAPGGGTAAYVRVDAELSHLGPISVRLSGIDGGAMAITLVAAPGSAPDLVEALPELVQDLKKLGIFAGLRVVSDDGIEHGGAVSHGE